MIPDFSLFGETLFRLQPDKPVIRSQEIHQLTQRWQTPSRSQFREGDAPPDWPKMRIVEVDPSEEIEGHAYDLRLSCEGIADDRSFLILDQVEDSQEEGWDTVNLTVYTESPNIQRWRKGSRIEDDAKEGAEGVATTSKITLPSHGLSTGQLARVTFAAGFGGLTSGSAYFAAAINSNQIYFCATKANALAALVTAPAAAHAITGNGSTHKIAWTAHGLSDGDVVIFPALTGGAGLTAATRPYYVINKTTDDFQVSETSGGSVVAFSTNISAGTCQPGSAIKLSSDGEEMTLHAIPLGLELCFITDRRKHHARAKGYYELDLQLKGLLQGEGDSKPVKRRINTTAQTVTDDKFEALVVAGVYVGFPPELTGTATFGASGGTAEFDLPQISVTDTFITDQAPPTWLIPGYWIPTDAPPVNIISTGGSAFTYHFPNGWKCLNLQSEQIPGKQLWLLSVTWGYQVGVTPKTAPDP
jgi:hypothetical protein